MMSFWFFVGVQFAVALGSFFQVPPQEIVMVTQEEIQTTPLFQMQDVPNTFATLFGDSQADPILKKWNPDLGFQASDSYLSVEKVNFPLIYPSLSSAFPYNLSDLREKVIFSKEELKAFENPHFVIVLHTDQDKSVLAYYQDQKLKLATFVSLGKKTMRTKAGVFSLKHDKIFRRSFSFNGSPMPYAMQYSGSYFLRWGEG